ncbi:MAG TPA: iron-sulfur cluster biosynthesis family protein [Bacilli bacterium]
MHIEMSSSALSRLREQLADKTGYLKLVYDTDNCCAVNGIAQLWLVAEPGADDIVQDGEIPIMHEHEQEIFFEDDLQLDYSEKNRCYILKSNQQIYHPTLSIIDKRTDRILQG